MVINDITWRIALMSEYQRYEFMTIDRPLTRAQLDVVNDLSSHITASATHALIEYNWGDFRHDPIDVLYKYFDGFLYWANWGAPELGLRFPHGALPADLFEGYDLDDFLAFTQHPDYDILDIHFGELEGPDVWTEYELGSLIGIRDELMEGDLRSLYIVWLGSQRMMASYDEEEDYEVSTPPVPPAFGMLTEAQQALAELLQVPQELLVAAAHHSNIIKQSTEDDFAAWVSLLPLERRNEYLVRLAGNEPGLSRLLVKELRELGRGEVTVIRPEGEHITYATLLAESKDVKAQLEREKREQERLAHQRHLQGTYDRRDDYWHQADKAVSRGSGTGYDEAAQLLVELREAAAHFKASQEFQDRFYAWIRPHLSRPAFIKRLRDRKFTLPEA
jgi:SOS-response transcriptional repressor LexA